MHRRLLFKFRERKNRLTATDSHHRSSKGQLDYKKLTIFSLSIMLKHPKNLKVEMYLSLKLSKIAFKGIFYFILGSNGSGDV